MPYKAGGERNCYLSYRPVWIFIGFTKPNSRSAIRSSKHFCRAAGAVKYAPQTEVSLEEQKRLKGNRKKANKHAPSFNLSRLAYQYFKTDLFAISGISHNAVLCILTNMGHDVHKFPTAKSFACWLGLVPNNTISGGKIISHRTPSGKNYIAKALRHAANSIGNQKDHEFTPFFKRIAFKKGRVVAITATARKLAVIIWHMIVKAEP